MKKYNFLLAGFVLMSCSTISAKDKQLKPNIIFIFADDMGYSDMSWQTI